MAFFADRGVITAIIDLAVMSKSQSLVFLIIDFNSYEEEYRVYLLR
jgi:hypothetical protein